MAAPLNCPAPPPLTSAPPRPRPRREPIYRKTYLELDRADERLKFYTIDEAKLLPEQRQGLPLSDSCKPVFVVFKDKVAINKVHGVNAPELESVIADNIPPVPKDEEVRRRGRATRRAPRAHPQH